MNGEQVILDVSLSGGEEITSWSGFGADLRIQVLTSGKSVKLFLEAAREFGLL